MRTGFGYDVHAFCEGRKLILGGVDIPFDLGLAGHSDADVLVHSVMDALLGSLALGDIGQHFPDNDEKYLNINSLTLLKKVYALIRNEGYELVNADCVVVAQKPKLMDYIDKMRSNIAYTLNTDIKNISVKATTEEKLGFTGNMGGIKAYCSCLVENTDKTH